MPAAETLFPAAERDRLFGAFLPYERIVLAVSGGPDSTALLALAHQWRSARTTGPALAVVTIDHGLRPESADEAAQVAALCGTLGLPHTTLRWQGEKPTTGLQEAARIARYHLLLSYAGASGAGAIALAHTRDDQAETVLFRLARGSGLPGLAAMRARARREEIDLLRPLLDVPKARLVGFLEGEGIAYVRDPSNTDPRFTRPRLRTLLPALAAEGLDAGRLSRLAARFARADAALAGQALTARGACLLTDAATGSALDAGRLFAEAEEISLRILVAEVSRFGTEGEAELGKAERLHAELKAAFSARNACARTLAGAMVRLKGEALTIGPAPARRKKPVPLAANSPR